MTPAERLLARRYAAELAELLDHERAKQARVDGAPLTSDPKRRALGRLIRRHPREYRLLAGDEIGNG